MVNNQDLVVTKKDTVPSNSSATKALYIVVTEDPTVKTKQRTYFALRQTQGVASVEMTGFEVTDSKIIAQILNAESVNDAIKIAKSNDIVQETITIPWHRIVRIKNFILSII